MDVARGPNPDSLSRSIDIQISRLRRKIEKDSRNPEIIVTVRNEGYLFSALVERRSSSARTP
ncbi:MAG: helix-turn-helix domain-containing protein [Pseudomonadota bacterium]